jgi:hypothetical protein
MGADLVRWVPETSQKRVHNPDWRPSGDARPFVERGLPKLLQPGHEIRPHPGCDVAVDAAHAGYLVAHTFGLQDVSDAQLVQPSLVAVAQAVRCQAGRNGSQEATGTGSAGS